MRHASKVLLVVLSLGFLVGGCTCEKPEPWQLSPPEKPTPTAPPAPPPPVATISVVPSPAMGEYWNGVRAGLAKAAPEMPRIGIDWRPATSKDTAAQTQMVEKLVQQHAKVILLGPADAEALAAPAKAARDAGTSVIVIGQPPSDPESYDCAVAGDFGALGAAAAKALAKVVGSSGQVVLLRFQPGGLAAEECEKGFLAAMGAYPGIKVTTSERFSGATPDWAASAARTELKKLGEDNVDGVFCCDDVGLQGMVQLLKSGDYAGKLAGCGYSPPLREAMDAGLLDALVFANPMRAGYDGAKAAAARIEGKAVPKTIAGEIVVVTVENAHTPDIRRILNPR